MRHVTAILLGAAGLAACATAAPEPAGPPSLVAAPGVPAPPQARFYADCIAQAAASGAYDREGTTLRFTCTGEPAQAFHSALAARSALLGSQYDLADGRVLRVTQAVERDLSGLDHCSATADGADARCVVVLRVGEFLND